jgi:hypothetical protein
VTLAVNLPDVAAMGATPRLALLLLTCGTIGARDPRADRRLSRSRPRRA